MHFKLVVVTALVAAGAACTRSNAAFQAETEESVENPENPSSGASTAGDTWVLWPESGGPSGVTSNATSQTQCPPDSECLGLPGAPWEGPVSVSITDSVREGACASGAYSELLRDGSTGQVPSEVSCCSCLAVDAECEATRTFSRESTCEPGEPTDFANGADCMPTSELAHEYFSAVSEEVEPAQCVAQGPFEGPIDGLEPALICGVEPDAEASCSGGTCVPQPAAGDALCVFAREELACPDGWGDRKEVFSVQAPDCSACTCALEAGGGCEAELSAFTDAGCTEPSFDTVEAALLECTLIDGVGLVEGGSHTITAVADPTICAGPTEEERSAVVREELWTVCCLELRS